MSYYRPNFSPTVSMTRGRGFSSRGSYRGNSRGGGGGHPWGGHSGGGGRGGGYSPRGRDDRFHSSRPHSEDYRRSYRDSYPGRDRSPERKRMRHEAPSTRHDSYGGYGASRYESYSDRRSFSGERHSGSISRRDEFRRPSGPPPPPRGGYRGRLSSRGIRGLKHRDRPTRRRLIESSYPVRKRLIRSTDIARRIKISKMRSAIARRVVKKKERDPEKDESEEKPEEDKEDNEKEEETKIEGEKTPLKEKDISEKEDEETKVSKKPFIKLLCPHCNVKAFTFRKYEMHLSSRAHLMTMRKLAIKQKGILAQMRTAQRNTQNELEKTCEDLTAKTNFCPLCKLNYKQRKTVHQSSEAHKNMKKFLMPFCKICRYTFKSPMIYESHCCSIDHMKRKQRFQNSNSDGSGEEDNLENFTTIDSVGEDTEEKKEEDEPANLGIEQIRQLKAHYCDLCKMYLARGEESEMASIIEKHCKLRVHRKRYARHQAANTTKDSVDTVKAEGDEATEDKMWEDVDKDLGDIIAEAESGNKSSDDEDSHVNGERYDRFKLSEKNGEEKINGDEKDETVEEKVPETVEAK